jgi:hypothetical protein
MSAKLCSAGSVGGWFHKIVNFVSSEMRRAVLLDSKLCAIVRTYCNAHANRKNKVTNALSRVISGFQLMS